MSLFVVFVCTSANNIPLVLVIFNRHFLGYRYSANSVENHVDQINSTVVIVTTVHILVQIFKMQIWKQLQLHDVFIPRHSLSWEIALECSIFSSVYLGGTFVEVSLVIY
jgi:hypothetical protein